MSMSITKWVVPNESSLFPSKFCTGTEFANLKDTFSPPYCIIPADEFAAKLKVKLEGSQVRATGTSEGLAVFDNEIHQKCSDLPRGVTIHFNKETRVIGVTEAAGLTSGALTYKDTVDILAGTPFQRAKMRMTTYTKDFIPILVRTLVEGKGAQRGLGRVGVYVGDRPLFHLNYLALSGVLASGLDLVAGIRLSSIYTHEPDYVETVFWLEILKWDTELFEVLEEHRTDRTFFEKLVTCF